ncbi:MAG TPA: ABC transporter permease [Acidimicrobiia bacterium]|nr:ABC transporter permease [Acidimicrobiia bacterium]
MTEDYAASITVEGETAGAGLEPSLSPEARSFARQVWDRFRHHRVAMVSVAVLGILVAAFWIVPALSPYEFDQLTPDLRQGPSWEHPFGTDQIGRDLMVRTFMGGRFSIRIALLVAVVATAFGTLLGAFSGYFGGWVDAAVSQFINLVLVVPALAVLLVLALRWGSGPWALALILAGLLWVRIARVVRGLFLSTREADFVQAARAAGAKAPRIMFRHILPNAIGPIVVEMTLLVGTAIILESTVSFLGLGVQFPIPTLGNLINEAKGAIDTVPSRILFPGAVAVFITLGVNFIGDGLRDALDPAGQR